MISEIDSEIGKIRTELEEKGIAENTVIILMGDNGYFEGERQLAGKWLMYDNSLRVPLVVFDPRKREHRDISEMALNIDIPSTIIDLAGLPVPSSWQGKSLAGFLSGQNPLAQRDGFVCEHLWKVNIIAPSEGFRTKKWKYFRYRNDPGHEELYDLENDPMEMNNLADSARVQDVLHDLRGKTDSESLILVQAKQK